MKTPDLPPELQQAAPVRRRRGLTGWFVLAGLLVVVAVAAWFGREKLSGGTFGAAPGASAAGSGAAAGAARRFGGPNRVQPVSVQAVRRQDLRVTIMAIGTLTAANTATVRAQVSGVLQTLNFKEGEPVRAGQLLAQIDPRAFQAALAQAEGNLARDKAQLDNARIDLQRYQDLFKQDAVARQVLDTQQALVHQLEGTVRADQGNVDSARLQLSYTRVTAPISGRAGLKQAYLGNVVSPSDSNGIVVVAQTKPVALVFAVPSANIGSITGQLRSGEPLVVEAWDRTGKTRLAVGRVASLDNAIDTTTDSVRLKALFPNADDALYPNQSVSVRLRIATVKDALAVPQAALLRGAQGFYVYVVGNDSSVAVRNVQPGATDGDWTEVSGALQAGDRVVIDGVDRLRDGAKVEVIAADPTKRQGANAASRPQLSPEMREKVRAMSPEERRAFFEKLRAASAAGNASGNASGSLPGNNPGIAPGNAPGPAPANASAATPGDWSRPGGAERPASGADGERPRISPELREKLRAMEPEERRAFIDKLRAARAASAATPGAAP
jgi:multidrug efflux system membrane fusion protein